MGDAAKRDADERLVEAVERLEHTVGRFVVVLERMLASNDAAKTQSQRALEKMHPNFAKIQAEVRAKLACRKLGG